MSPGRKRPTPELSPLPPEVQARLDQVLAALSQALAEGAGLSRLLELAGGPEPHPAWPDHLLAALTRLHHPAVPALLAGLFGKDPARRKALKKALHRFRTRGVPVPENLLPREEAAPLAAAPAVSARMTPIFGRGEGFLLLEGSRTVLGGTLVVARLSDTAGLLEFHILAANRAQRQELRESLAAQGLAEWAEVPPSYAVRLLEEAYALNPASPGAGEYLSLRERLWRHLGRPQEAPDPERDLPPVSDRERAPALERARELARHPWFHSWLPTPEEVAPWVGKIREAQASPLILAEHQQRARLEGILEEAARALYPPETRELLRRRLLKQAYFCHLRGLSREAQALWAAAQDLADRATSPLMGESPFLLALVQTAVMLALEYQRQTAAASGPGLVTPPEISPLLVRK